MTAPIERDFPDIQRLLSTLFEPTVGAGHTGSETPDDLAAKLPFLRAVRVSGGRGPIYDFPIVELDYFDVNELVGAPRASAIANRLLAKPPPHPSLDTVSCEPVFRELPWGDNETIRRWGATFFFTTRRVRLSTLP